VVKDTIDLNKISVFCSNSSRGLHGAAVAVLLFPYYNFLS